MQPICPVPPYPSFGQQYRELVSGLRKSGVIYIGGEHTITWFMRKRSYHVRGGMRFVWKCVMTQPDGTQIVREHKKIEEAFISCANYIF